MSQKKVTNYWLLIVALMISGAACFVSCSSDNGSSRRQYEAEVYYYLNKANERENPGETTIDVHRATIWRLEERNQKEELPNKFRTCRDELTAAPTDEYSLPEPNYVPSREGLDELCISGSARFSLSEMEVLMQQIDELAGDRPKVMIDLRGECHGFVNGMQMSLYGFRNWSNIGRHRDEILAIEEKALEDIKGTIITGWTISSDNDYDKAEPSLIAVDETSTEKQAVENAGWEYRRVTALDHTFPCDEIIDQFLEVYRSLPKDAWIHFHGHKGNGRTTTFMSFYDMLRNPNVPLKDILYRQAMLGGANLYYKGDAATELEWRVPLYREINWMIPLLYDYVQDNKDNGYQVSWSEWKKDTFR